MADPILLAKNGDVECHFLPGLAEMAARSAARSVGSAIGRQIIRGVLGSLLGGGAKRRR